MQPALRTLSKSFECHLLATNRSARTVQTYLCELESLERIEAQMKQENEAARVELTIVAQAPGLDTPAQAEVIELVSRWGDQLTDDKVAYGTEAGLSDQAAIPTVVVGPGDIAQAHAPDESSASSRSSAASSSSTPSSPTRAPDRPTARSR